MHTEVDSRAFKADVMHSLKQQDSLNEALCAENCVARWLWKSGTLSPNGYAVPWEV